MVVELLGNALMLHQKVLSEGRTVELDVQLPLAYKDLTRVAADGIAHHLRPRLHDAVLQQRRLQALLPEEGQQDIADARPSPSFPRGG